MPVPPVINEAFTFYVFLPSQADTNIFQVNPTLALGDIQVSVDGGAFGNVLSAAVVPALGTQVEIQLSAAQTNGAWISLLAHDVAGAEWQDRGWGFPTDAQHIGDIPTAAAITIAVWASATRTLTSYGTLVADTAAAVWAYATRTLTSISAIASDIWGYATRTLTQSATQVTAAVSGSDIAVKSYSTWDIDLTGIGDISARTALYFTAKGDAENDPDTLAIVSIEETLGLLYIDGAAATAAADGSITVTDEIAGDITITVSADVTGIGRKQGQYGVKMVTASAVQMMCDGWFGVDTPSPRAVA